VASLGNLIYNVSAVAKEKSDSFLALSIRRANEALQHLEGLGPFPFRRVHGSIIIPADYEATVTLTVTNGERTALLTGATLTDAMNLSHLLMGSQRKDYLIIAVNTSTNVLTLDRPYEGTTITTTSTSILIRKRWHYLPYDFESWFIGHQGQTPRPVNLADVSAYDDTIQQNLGASGEPEVVLERGASRFPFYSTGTLTVVNKSESVTLATGAFRTDYIGLPLAVRGKMNDHELYEYTSSSAMKIRPAWDGQGGSSQEFEIAPAGTRIVEVYPHPGALRNVDVLYYGLSPRLVHLPDVPRYLPHRFHPLWEMETLARLNQKYDLQKYAELRGELTAGCSISSGAPRQRQAYGESARGLINNSPYGYVPHDMWGGEWQS